MLNILSIDQSLRNSGVCGYVRDVIIKSSIQPKSKGVERLFEIKEKLQEYFEGYQIHIAIMESYSYGSAGKGLSFNLGELGGMIKLFCYERKTPLLIMPIGTHKMFTTGKGNTKKDLMLKEVYKKYGEDVNDDNIADAISMLKTFLGYIDWMKQRKSFTKIEVKALTKLDEIIKENSEVFSLVHSCNS